jgi:hypothetical protein
MNVAKRVLSVGQHFCTCASETQASAPKKVDSKNKSKFFDSNQNVFLELRHVFNKEIEVLEIRCLVGTKNPTYR